jgi:hypothetical protein
MSLLTSDDQDDRYERLFNNRNIGMQHRTNMQIPGQFPYDSVFVMANVYTRTNIAKPKPTLDDAKQKEVRDLFAAGHDGDAIGALLKDLRWERSPLTRALEEWSHTAIVTVVIGDKPMLTMNVHDLMDGPALGPVHVPAPKKEEHRSHDQADEEQEPLPWRKQLGRVIIVPVRQNFSVQITSPAAPARALRAIATEAGILPEPLLWVHVEGLLTRDVY